MHELGRSEGATAVEYALMVGFIAAVMQRHIAKCRRNARSHIANHAKTVYEESLCFQPAT